jgi:uncharacterized protein (TIGR03086 family)
MREFSMTEPELFMNANKALRGVILEIKDDQWDLEVPAAMSWRPSQTLHDIVNYHTYDDAWVPDVLAGKTAEEVGDQYEHLQTTTDTIPEYKKYNDRATEFVRTYADLKRKVHLSYGDFTAQEYLQHITVFRGFRSHDIAQFIGLKYEMSDELVQGLWDIIEPQAEYLRKMGVFGPAVEVPEEAPLRDRLLGLSGRQPS